MDPIIILILVFFALLVLIAILSRKRTPETEKPQDDSMTETFEFAPDEQGAVPLVARRLRVVAPGQRVNGTMQKIRIIPQPLAQVGNPVVPPEKGIESLNVLVVNPVVRLADSDQEINEFDPPLTLTVWYTKQDVGTAKLAASGAPSMSLITGYETADGWKFERLLTEVTINSETGEGTLIAQVQTLAPKDPVWAGLP